MEDYQSLSHTKWDCKYHMVWIPKYRKKVLYGQLRKELGPVLRELAIQRESEVIEGQLVVVGYIKGKSAMWVARTMGRTRNFMGQNFWARGYCVSTTGLDEEMIREYIRTQEEMDKKLDQLKMFE